MSSMVKLKFKIGDKVHSLQSKTIGVVVYVHYKDDIPYIVDFGDYWLGQYSNELALVKTKKVKK